MSRLWLVGLLFAGLLLIGCAAESEGDRPEKPPVPVSVIQPRRFPYAHRQLIAASVVPWKTEQIGFEIPGRISSVLEPMEEVSPRLELESASPPTVLARLESERFQIAVETANADLAVAEQRLAVNTVAIRKRLPTAISAAEAELELASAELSRLTGLFQQNAVSRSEFDDARKVSKVAKSRLEAARAELDQAEAEQQALQAQISRARHALAEAKRNLKNTTLYSSFRGIVSETHTVPGSYVQPGEPVITVQMMDPVLVQFEVSSGDSRKYSRGDILEIYLGNSDGTRRSVNGMVYTVDSVADPNSRTYTVTLHVRNQKQWLSDRRQATQDVAETTGVYPLNLGPIITGDDRLMVEKECLHRFEGRSWIWKVTNRKWDQTSEASNRVLTVEPIEVVPGDTSVTLLGQWEFVPVQLPANAQVDVKRDLIVGELSFSNPSNAANPLAWKERKVFIRQANWMLRAGDVVQVAMAQSQAGDGLYLPMKAVLYQNGKAWIHKIETNGQTGDSNLATVKRVEVAVATRAYGTEDSIQIRVIPVVSGSVTEASTVVDSGTHFLNDGDQVRVVAAAGGDD